MSFTAYYLSPDGKVEYGLNEKQIKTAYESGQGLLWLDVCETTEDDGNFLANTLNLHSLAVEDCVSPLVHPPKIDDFDKYIFIILHGINHTAESDIVETAELAIFVGEHFIITNHNCPLYSVEAIKQQVERHI